MTSKKLLALNNVLYMPKIWKNLVSGSLLNKHKFKMVFDSDKGIFSKFRMYVGKSYMSHWIFRPNVITVINKIDNASTYMLESFNLWHGRLGYVNYNSM